MYFTPFIIKNLGTLSFATLEAGTTGTLHTNSGLQRPIELVSYAEVSKSARALNPALVIDGCTNGLYTNGLTVYQIAFRYLR